MGCYEKLTSSQADPVYLTPESCYEMNDSSETLENR